MAYMNEYTKIEHQLEDQIDNNINAFTADHNLRVRNLTNPARAEEKQEVIEARYTPKMFLCLGYVWRTAQRW